MKLALLNTTIATTDGNYEIKTITLDEAKYLVSSNKLESAIGHESTAQLMSTLLGVDIRMNRQQFVQGVGQQALVFKLKGRVPEGTILEEFQIKSIGFEFKLMTRTHRPIVSFKVGDRVSYTNDYGYPFKCTVVGFSDELGAEGEFILLDGQMIKVSPRSLCKIHLPQGDVKTLNVARLNCGDNILYKGVVREVLKVEATSGHYCYGNAPYRLTLKGLDDAISCTKFDIFDIC